MATHDAVLDNWINDAIATQLPERQMSLSLDDAELLAKLVREAATACHVPVVFSLADACGHQRFFQHGSRSAGEPYPGTAKGLDRRGAKDGDA